MGVVCVRGITAGGVGDFGSSCRTSIARRRYRKGLEDEVGHVSCNSTIHVIGRFYVYGLHIPIYAINT